MYKKKLTSTSDPKGIWHMNYHAGSGFQSLVLKFHTLFYTVENERPGTKNYAYRHLEFLFIYPQIRYNLLHLWIKFPWFRETVFLKSANCIFDAPRIESWNAHVNRTFSTPHMASTVKSKLEIDISIKQVNP